MQTGGHEYGPYKGARIYTHTLIGGGTGKGGHVRISRKTEENEATLGSYLTASGEDRGVLFGGYALERAGED